MKAISISMATTQNSQTKDKYYNGHNGERHNKYIRRRKLTNQRKQHQSWILQRIQFKRARHTKPTRRTQRYTLTIYYKLFLQRTRQRRRN